MHDVSFVKPLARSSEPRKLKPLYASIRKHFLMRNVHTRGPFVSVALATGTVSGTDGIEAVASGGGDNGFSVKLIEA